MTAPPLETSHLLSLSEDTAGVHPIDAALRILGSAFPLRDAAELARLPLGARDVLLLGVRAATFGDRLEARECCPACSMDIEVGLQCNTLAVQGGDLPPEQWSLAVDGYDLELRPLDSMDAAAAAWTGDEATARDMLLQRALIAASRDGQSMTIDELPASVIDAAVVSLSAHDPGSEIVLAFRCPQCKARWTNVLDIASFVTSEVAARGQRLMADVDALARAYGWSEAEILRLGEGRRAAYVAMVQG
jgi:hypothetical protein